MKHVIAMVAFVASLAACSGTSGEDTVVADDDAVGEKTDTTSEAFFNGYLYGSDALKTAIVDYTVAATPKPQPVYRGRGAASAKARIPARPA
jgi:hypothetical protein